MLLQKNHLFRKMFIAYGLATLGSWFDFIAVAILLGFIWHADPLTIALLPLMYAGPGILFGQIAGILADRWNKLHIMIYSDLIRAAFTLLLIFAPHPFWTLPLIFCRSVANVFHTPAQQAMTRSVVSEEELLKASTLNGAVFQAGKVFGPLIGGSAAAAFSPKLCMLVNICCFILSACFLLSIKKHTEVERTYESLQQDIRLGKAWKEGWAIILGNRLLLFSLLFSLTGIIAIQMVDAQFAVILREKAPEYPQLVGWTVAAIGIGALITVAWFHRYNQISAYGWMFGGGMVLIGILFASFGLYQAGQPIWLLLCPALIGGVGTGLTSVASTYLLQKEAPKEAVGRVMGIVDSIQSAVFITAPLGGGLFIHAMGASESFQWIGCAIITIGLVGISIQRLLWGHSGKNKMKADFEQFTS